MMLKTFLLALPLALSLAFSPSRAGAQVPAGNAFVVKPYLQIGRTPSPTTLQLMWHGPDESGEWMVEYQTAPQAAWQAATAARVTRLAVAGVAPRKIYDVALTGLVPGSSFNYRILQGGKPVFTAEALAPKSAEQPFRFVAFGDVGAGTVEQKAMARRALLSKPDLVVVPGDIVYEYGLVSEYDKNFWPIYNAEAGDAIGVPLMRRVPMVTVPGNHDTDNRDLNKYPDALGYFFFWDQPLNGPLGVEGGPFVPPLKGTEEARKQFLQTAGESYPRMANYSFNYGNVHWTVLDSNPYVDWTNKELHDWIAKDLADAAGATWRIVTFHHPGFNSSIEHLEQQHMRLISPVLEAGKVDMVFNGHLHNYQRSFPLTFKPFRTGTLMVGGRDGKTVRGRVVNGHWVLDKSFDGRSRTQPKGVVYVVTGAGGKELYNVEQQDDPDTWQKFTDKFISKVHSLTVVDVDGKRLTVRQLTADGTEVDNFVVTK